MLAAARFEAGNERATAINLYVGNLPFSTTSDDLANLFAKVGAVTSAQVVTDRETGRSRGFGFVEMGDEDARKAIDELTGTQLGGRPITVNEARPAVAGGRRATTAATEPRTPTKRRHFGGLRRDFEDQLVMAPVSAPLTSLAYLPSTPVV